MISDQRARKRGGSAAATVMGKTRSGESSESVVAGAPGAESVPAADPGATAAPTLTGERTQRHAGMSAAPPPTINPAWCRRRSAMGPFMSGVIGERGRIVAWRRK